MAVLVLACALGGCANPDRGPVEFPRLPPAPNTPSLNENEGGARTRATPAPSIPVDGNDEPSQASPSNKPLPFTPYFTVVY